MSFEIYSGRFGRKFQKSCFRETSSVRQIAVALEHYGLYLWGRDPERGHTGGCGGPRWDAVLGLSLSQSLLRNHHQLTHLCPDQHHTSNTHNTHGLFTSDLWKIHKASQNSAWNITFTINNWSLWILLKAKLNNSDAKSFLYKKTILAYV